MDKQKAIELVRLAPTGWGYYSEHADSFFCKISNLWCVFDRNRGGWGVCEPSIRAKRDMMPKSEILKIAEGEEMKDKSYPYIGKDNYNKICLMLSSSYALTMDGYSFTHTPMQEGGYTNITQEYLANTYGEVVSPEHAEFIIKLARANDIDVCKSFRDGLFFNFYRRKGSGKLVLFFFHEDKAKEGGEKLITIPLPPKQIQTATPEEEFEMTQIMKNAGDNLVLGCEDSKCDEWSCVGSIVTWGNKSVKGEVKALSDGLAWIKNEYGNYCTEYVSSLQKPKTPEEELRDEIELIIKESLDEDYSPSANAEHIRSEILSKYNITKKPQ